MKILLLEDDNNWADEIQAEIKKSFSASTLTRIATEWSFRRQLKALGATGFDVAILDVMVRWAGVEEILDQNAMSDVPADVARELDGESKWRAGVRCCRLLTDAALAAGTRPPALIFFSVLLQSDLGEDIKALDSAVPLVVKGDETDARRYAPLIEAIHGALKTRRDQWVKKPEHEKS